MVPKREPFGMFYVAVDPNSKWEKILGIATMAPYFLVCAMVVLAARCRELLTITWLVGQLGNEVANYVLKRVLKEPRPPGAPRVGMHESGMPSNHAQFMGFFVAFSIMVVSFRLRGYHPAERLAAVAGSLALGLLVCHSRLVFGFHTVPQVAVGFAIGVVFGMAWFAFASGFLFPSFPAAVETWLGRALMLRDGAHVPNVVRFEREAYHPSGGRKQT